MKYLALLLSLTTLTACFSTRNKPADTAELTLVQSPPASNVLYELNEDLIVQNLIFTLAQVSDLHPLKTTLSLKKPATALGALVESRFTDAGYGIKHVDSDQGEHYVSYAAQNAQTEDGEKTTYRIAVGSIDSEREYSIEGKFTHPTSVMRINGVQEQDILINDDVFGAEYADSQYKEVYFESNELPQVRDVSGADVESALVANLQPQPSTNPSFKDFVKKNMREIMSSNYASIFDTYEDVSQVILVFPNDSLKIGSKNKDTVRDYVRAFNPETDILSVVGCSHGKSAVSKGNQLLAVGRANRVKEALIFSGIDQESIYEEGCWDTEHFDEVMPRRGVVLTHKRLAANG